MVRIVLQGALCLDGRRRTLILDDGRIEEVINGNRKGKDSDRTIDCRKLLVMPGLCNSHTHSAMTLLRGAGEDMELERWLNERIWPAEARMTADHIRAGMDLAVLEMIRTGTTLFNDMYFMQAEVADAVAGTGIRAVLGDGFIDLFDEEKREKGIKDIIRGLDAIKGMDHDTVTSSICPHAVYTVSREGLEWCRETADERNLPVHIHISETEKEVRDSVRTFGKTPPAYLDEISFLGPDVTAAHCVHTDDEDLSILSRKGVSVSHVPVSNMKLSVGGQFGYADARTAGIEITLGTDGAASNNSLDMFQTMKTAALLCKNRYGASSVKASQIIDNATLDGYSSLGMPGGRLREGYLADIILLGMDDTSMTPLLDPLSNVVYSCTGSSVLYTIVNGRILMDNGRVEGEERIIENAKKAARDLMGAAG